MPTQPDLAKKLMDERVTIGGIFTILQRLCSWVFSLKMSEQFGFNGGASAPPRVAQMKEPAMCNGCVWHCAEPQGPGVNITWQCEKGGPKKRHFWSLIHLSPVSSVAVPCLDDGGMILHRQSQRRAHNVTVSRDGGMEKRAHWWGLEIEELKD